MKKFRWQLVIIFLTGLVVGVLLLSEQPESLSTLAPEPAKGGIYSEALIGSMQRLNPLLDDYNSVDADVDSLIYSGLLRFDNNGMPQPDLAESWGVTKDGTIYTFTLRQGIRWHDGEPLTTDDVIFTVDLIREGTDVVPADVQAFWKEVEVVYLTEYTLQFKLPETYAPFLDYLTFGILPQHLLGDLTFQEIVNAPFNLQPVGSGPYRFDRLIVEEGQITGVVLKAFENYYTKPPYIDQLVFRYYPDGASALLGYQDGEVKGIGRVDRDILDKVLIEPKLSLYTGRNPGLTMVLFNLNNPDKAFFKDKVVRQALYTGLNRQWIIDRILAGQAIMADGPILPGTWAYYGGLERVDYDAEKARTLLKDGGYVVSGEGENIRVKDNVPLSFVLLYPDTHEHQAIAEHIQQNWGLIDVKVELEAVPYEELVNGRLQNRNYEAALVDLNLARSPDPDPYPFWDQAQATGGQNYSQWDHRLASEYLEQARITVDFTDRARFYRNFQVIFTQEIPALPLYYPVYTYAVDSQVQGVSMGPLFNSSDRFATIMKWFMVTKQAVSGGEVVP